ncbi:syntaxin [Forsythia ovata]|uniref:Syntaxin n=1 Tax=Forsythia ovata TaxID=205694 RepID=A0ABD1U716_9LAMI
MAANFDRWEKDPFFSAAEEVQDSADRMESTYRTWIHAKKDSSGVWNSNELRRDLQTTLGTAKWQLEEFERAVNLSYTSSSSADDAKDRHGDFIHAIESQISKVESSLNESTVSQGKPPLPWVQLNEGERNELALFLSGPPSSSIDKIVASVHGRDQGMEFLQEAGKQSMPECSRSSANLVECGRVDANEEKFPGHRRTASASADIGSWNIAVADDVLLHSSSSEQPDPPPRKIPSFSGLLNTMESSVSKLKWSKNGYRKLKLMDHHQEADIALPQTQNLTRGINICYEKNKSCLDGCDDYYDKQLYGWGGAIQRQIQRSQYHMQYSRPLQVAFSTTLLLCLIVLLALFAV